MEFYKCQDTEKNITSWTHNLGKEDISSSYTELGNTGNKAKCLFICCQHEWCLSVIHHGKKCYGKGSRINGHKKHLGNFAAGDPKRFAVAEERKRDKEGVYSFGIQLFFCQFLVLEPVAPVTIQKHKSKHQRMYK